VRRIVIGGAAALAACGALGMAPAAVQASSASAATWTRQAPAVRPSPRAAAVMAYGAAAGTVVLFGGDSYQGNYLGDTSVASSRAGAPRWRGHSSTTQSNSLTT
jgi:cobalamin biosynthesis protein CobD/CbiB